MMTMITMMTMMLMARVCEGNGDGDVYDDSGGYGDDYYSGELKEACLNCVVGAIVIKDADDILNNFLTSLVLAFSKHLLLLAISCIYSDELFVWSVSHSCASSTLVQYFSPEVFQ